MVKKSVSVSVGRSQLLSSFFLLNRACVCSSERPRNKRFMERTAAAVLWVQKGPHVWGMGMCGGAASRGVQVLEAGNTVRSVFLTLCYSCLEDGHMTSSCRSGSQLYLGILSSFFKSIFYWLYYYSCPKLSPFVPLPLVPPFLPAIPLPLIHVHEWCM